MRWSECFIVLLSLCATPAVATAEDSEELDESGTGMPLVEIILFTPADVPPPPESEAALRQLAENAEKFFIAGMTSWGYEPARKQFFSRDEKGNIPIRFVRGDRPASSGAYDKSGFGSKVISSAVDTYRITRRGNIYWVFVHLGPDRKFRNWVGTGTPASGGKCMVGYTPGGLFRQPHGQLHELGHAMGLFHLGPRTGDPIPCNIMGSGPEQVQRRLKVDCGERLWLEEASAAMLWKHPIFSGTADDRKRRPKKVELVKYEARFDHKLVATIVTGTIASEMPFHSVVVVDDAEQGQEGYWHKGYVGRADGDGSFQVAVREPLRSSGTLMLLPCFENGMNVGAGKAAGNMALGGAFKKKYVWDGRSFSFE